VADASLRSSALFASQVSWPGGPGCVSTRRARGANATPLAHSRLTLLNLFQRPNDALRFVPGFLVFALRIGVGDNAAADRNLQPTSTNGACPDQDAAVHGAVKANIS